MTPLEENKEYFYSERQPRENLKDLLKRGSSENKKEGGGYGTVHNNTTNGRGKYGIVENERPRSKNFLNRGNNSEVGALNGNNGGPVYREDVRSILGSYEEKRLPIKIMGNINNSSHLEGSLL